MNNLDDLLDNCGVRELFGGEAKQVSKRGSLYTLPEESKLLPRNNDKTYRRDITKLVLLTSQDLPQNAPHDLPAPRLGQVRHDEYGLRRRERPDALADLEDELLPEGLGGLVAVLDGHEGVDSLASELVRDADHRRLRDGMVLDQGRLDLCSRQPVATDIDDVVHAPADPVKALVVSTGAVTRELLFSSWLADENDTGSKIC